MGVKLQHALPVPPVATESVTSTTYALLSSAALLMPTAELRAALKRPVVFWAGLLRGPASGVLEVRLVVERDEGLRLPLTTTTLRGATTRLVRAISTPVDIAPYLAESSLLVLRFEARVTTGTGELLAPLVLIGEAT